MSPDRRVLPARWNVRRRLLALTTGLLAAGLLLTGGITFALQYANLNERVDAELRQEVDELAAIAEAGPAFDDTPYTDVDALFYAFLGTAVAGDDESLMALVDGRPQYLSGGERAFDIDHPEILTTVMTLEVPEGRARTTSVRTQGTEIRLLVADVRLPEETREGHFVVGIDLGRQRAQIARQAGTFALISLGTLAVVGLVNHLVLGRLTRPLRELREATAEVSTESLSRRVEVEGADTDVAELVDRFNEMLGRLDAGVREQRQFLDDAAHELRTPLTIIRGNAELLDPHDPADVSASRDLVMAEVDRMQRLVDDLLMLARSQRPDFVQPASVDVTELALEAMDRITALGERGWRLRADAEGTVQADQQRVLQAVIQLAANAVKFSEAGTTIELGTHWVEPGSREAETALAAGARPAPRHLAVSVKDQGQGIPADQVGLVFDRFGRADNAAATDGSGLGLAIVQAIAHGHGGAVGVESLEGVGSVFTLWLPAGAAAAL